MQKEESETNRFAEAINSTFEILGPEAREKLFQQLSSCYHLDFGSASISDLPQIKYALIDAFGAGAASVLLKQLELELMRVDIS